MNPRQRQLRQRDTDQLIRMVPLEMDPMDELAMADHACRECERDLNHAIFEVDEPALRGRNPGGEPLQMVPAEDPIPESEPFDELESVLDSAIEPGL